MFLLIGLARAAFPNSKEFLSGSENLLNLAIYFSLGGSLATQQFAWDYLLLSSYISNLRVLLFLLLASGLFWRASSLYWNCLPCIWDHCDSFLYLISLWLLKPVRLWLLLFAGSATDTYRNKKWAGALWVVMCHLAIAGYNLFHATAPYDRTLHLTSCAECYRSEQLHLHFPFSAPIRAPTLGSRLLKRLLSWMDTCLFLPSDWVFPGWTFLQQLCYSPKTDS